MDVAAVADALGEDGRCERGAQAVPPGHRADRLPYQDTAVGRRDRVERADRQLELPGRVLGMELVHVHALSRQGGEQLGAVVAQFDLAGRAVGRTRGSGDERVVRCRGQAERPLDLDARPEGEPVQPLRVNDRTAQEGSAAAGVALALLGDAVDRGPGPAGLSGQDGQVVEVGEEAQIAVRGAEDVGGDDGVVREERVEDRGHADAPGRRRGEFRGRDRLHPAHARGVDVGQDDPVHTPPGQLRGQRGGALDLAGTAAGQGVGKGGHTSSTVASWTVGVSVSGFHGHRAELRYHGGGVGVRAPS